LAFTTRCGQHRPVGAGGQRPSGTPGPAADRTRRPRSPPRCG